MKCQSENLNIISYEIGIMTVLLRVRDEGIAFRGECAIFDKRVRWQQVCFHGTCSTCLSSNAPSSSLKNIPANNYRKSKLFLGAKSFMRNLNLHSPLLVPDPIVLASPFDAGLVVKKLIYYSTMMFILTQYFEISRTHYQRALNFFFRSYDTRQYSVT